MGRTCPKSVPQVENNNLSLEFVGKIKGIWFFGEMVFGGVTAEQEAVHLLSGYARP